MDIINLYYYTSIPLITCNLLFYSITTLSNSITSTQNVFRFIYEHKDNDYLIYKNEIKKFDLLNKIKIINSLIIDTIKKYIPNEDNYNKFMNTINNPIIENNEKDNFNVIDIKYNLFSLESTMNLSKQSEDKELFFGVKTKENTEADDKYLSEDRSLHKLIVLSKIDEPIAYSIISVIEIINNIITIMNKIKDKINEHQKLYFRSFYTLCLKKEISDLYQQNILLDLRYNIFIDLLKIYLPLKKIER